MEKIGFTGTSQGATFQQIKTLEKLLDPYGIEYEPDWEPKRNHDIVDATEWLIATPKKFEEIRSGTWATVRYAKKVKKPVTIIWPDGSIEEWKPQ